MKPKESVAASANPQLSREGGEVIQLAQGGVVASHGHKFKVFLIQEGLGNFGDASYYTREALESAVPLYEGKKFMVDHPGSFEEQDRPERSVRDIAGHYENVRLEESNGRAVIAADLCVLPGTTYDWVRTLLRQSLEYSKTHAGDLVGLSINAQGDASDSDLLEFIESGRVPAGAMPKLREAQAKGITSISVVNRITSATSCDLVTEAGAGGKPVSLIEQEKARMKVKSKEAAKKVAAKENDVDARAAKKEGEGDGTGGVGDKEQHDDEEQDKKLIADMMAKFSKAASGAPAEEAEEAEEADAAAAPKESEESEEANHNEADMTAAHEAFKHAKAAYGCESEEAAKIACAAVHTSKHFAAKKESEEAAKHEAEEKAKEAQPDPSKLSAGKKESAKEGDKVIALTAENARLKESLRKVDVEKHLDKSLRESGLPMAVTKKFREALGEPKTTQEIDKGLKLFKEAYQVGGEADGMGFVITAEKQETSQAAASYADCVIE